MASKYADSLAAQVEPWNYGVQRLPHGKGTKVQPLIDLWMQSDRYRSLSNGSKVSYNGYIKNMAAMDIGSKGGLMNLMAYKVSYNMVDCLKTIMLRSMKPATVIAHFSVMSSIWEFGIRCGRVTVNPWSKNKIKLDNMREVLWTREQIKLAVDKALELGYNLLALYILLAYHTAQRPFSDLRELKWSNVSSHNGKCVLDFVIGKTKQHIRLPLSDEAAKILSSSNRASEYILVTDTGVRLSPTGINLQFRKVRAAAGLPPELTLRDLRRTAVTEMAMSGATVSEIAACTGWRNADSVINRYAIVKQRTAQNAVDKRQNMHEEESVSNSLDFRSIFKHT